MISSFQVELTPLQFLEGSVLSPLQLSVLKNQYYRIAENKLRLSVDATNPQPLLDFAQNEAYLKGQLELLEVLFQTSETAKEEINILASQNSDT